MSITIQHTQESLCLAHIYALAGIAGANFTINCVFDYGVDGQFSPVAIRNGRRANTGFPLDFQAKATTNWELKDGKIIYDLEVKNYNDIASRTAAESTLLLILLCLPKTEGDWHGASCDETVMRHCCYWYTFNGEQSSNATTKRIFIPNENLLTPVALKRLLIMERERREAQVP